MASRTRRARVVLAVVAVAVIGLGVWAWEPVYWWVTTERVLHEDDGSGGTFRPLEDWEDWEDDPFWTDQPTRGWAHVHRWSGAGYGPGCIWYLSSGFKAVEGIAARDGAPGQVTYWKPDGSVLQQFIIGGTMQGSHFNRSPPWWWNVTDQTAPSMPAWMKDDEKWQRALDAQD